MKYVLLFLTVFLLSLGILQCTSKNPQEPEPEESSQVSTPSPAPSKDTILNSPPLRKDTLEEFTQVDGYNQIDWKILGRVKFEERFNEQIKQAVAYPIFHPTVKALDQQLIQIKGYVIPFEETGNASIVILSAFPFSSCFFCGGAGPESVIDVQLKKSSTRFKRDAMTTFRGRLRLNDTDLDYLNYILDEAEVVE